MSNTAAPTPTPADDLLKAQAAYDQAKARLEALYAGGKVPSLAAADRRRALLYRAALRLDAAKAV